MASWIVHLRVADKLIDKFNFLSPTEYIVGNIAPDSGVPNEDWSAFTPSTFISHFKVKNADGENEISVEKFKNEYLNKQQIENYNIKQLSFYLGYYNHLLTDTIWIRDIVTPLKNKYRKECETDCRSTYWEWKGDWYDLDFLYLQQHPNFRAFKIYKDATDFKNEYLDIFSSAAITNRREYIVNMYSAARENLEREYHYTTKQQMTDFVEKAVKEIEKINKAI